MTPSVGAPFPDFRLAGFDSERVRSERPLVVVIWRIGCSTSRLAVPFFGRLARAYPDAKVIGVCQEAQAEIDAYMDLGFEQLADLDLNVTRQFGITVVPTYFLTDASGLVLEEGTSWDRVRLEAIGARVAAMLGQPPVTLVTDGDGVPAFKPG